MQVQVFKTVLFIIFFLHNFVKIDTTQPFEDELGSNTPLQSNTVLEV